MLHSDLRYDFVRTWFTRLEDAAFADIERVYAELIAQGQKALEQSGVRFARTTIAYAADMRYVGQEHAVTVDLSPSVFKRRDRDAIKHHFDEVHQVRYGTSAPEERAEIVSLRATVTGVMKKPPLETIARGGAAPARSAQRGTRAVFFAERTLRTPAY